MPVSSTDYDLTNYAESNFAFLTPDPPTSVTATVENTDVFPYTVTVNWVRPSDIGTGTLSSYEVYRDSVLVATVDDLILTYEDEPPELFEYVYTVTATSNDGTSDASAEASITLSRHKTGKKLVSFPEVQHTQEIIRVRGNTRLPLDKEKIVIRASAFENTIHSISYKGVVSTIIEGTIKGTGSRNVKSKAMIIGSKLNNITESITIKGKKDYIILIDKIKQII